MARDGAAGRLFKKGEAHQRVRRWAGRPAGRLARRLVGRPAGRSAGRPAERPDRDFAQGWVMLSSLQSVWTCFMSHATMLGLLVVGW